jgi:glycerophosphoryl diester phosphodiesterase
MIILAHRGNLRGPDPVGENSLASIEAALELGFGIETDVRHDEDAGFYISHDLARPAPSALFARHAEAWRRYPDAVVALNIKELGRERELVAELAHAEVLDQLFLFDMELIEPARGQTAHLYRAISDRVALAARVSDRGEMVAQALGIAEASHIWLDEFDGPWATADTVATLKAANKQVYAVSPDLHGASLDTALKRWREFVHWGVDGICTDWPIALSEQLRGV